MCPLIKIYFQYIWGIVKQSQWYNVLQAFMAGLPLVDIVTDYYFIYITLTQENSESLERQVPHMLCKHVDQSV